MEQLCETAGPVGKDTGSVIPEGVSETGSETVEDVGGKSKDRLDHSRKSIREQIDTQRSTTSVSELDTAQHALLSVRGGTDQPLFDDDLNHSDKRESDWTINDGDQDEDASPSESDNDGSLSDALALLSIKRSDLPRNLSSLSSPCTRIRRRHLNAFAGSMSSSAQASTWIESSMLIFLSLQFLEVRGSDPCSGSKSSPKAS
ncbi:MAG: hypothetical protein M1821_001568 [Bathelium mastoideum]|nr:MAG: hypothetical protein M1821_001568 [Bathelium mastoideum]